LRVKRLAINYFSNVVVILHRKRRISLSTHMN
jgi:hypothetical protein